MCGIVGYIGRQEAASILVEGLRRLEYRGYDSAGVAVLNGGDIQLRRSVGKLLSLESLLKQQPIHGTLGIGHTRWATHGRPCEENAHPHLCCDNRIVVVHNGIIENYVELKQRLVEAGHTFRSQTDTEVIAHLIEDAFKGDLREAVVSALKQAHGSYAVGVVCTDDRSRFVAARKDSPLVLGIGENENFIASDVPALLPYTRRVVFLQDGDVAEITQDAVEVFDFDGNHVSREPQEIDWDPGMAEKAGYPHFMLKEIYEQRTTVRDTFRSRISLEDRRVKLDDLLAPSVAKALPKVCLVGCGTSYHAALVARFWFEEIAGVPCDVEIASEYRYRRSRKEPGTLVVAISQSGETADTLAALRDSKGKGLPTVAVCNAVGSTVTRDAGSTIYTYCGPEIGVASTKAFTGQLTALFLLALYIAQEKGTLKKEEMGTLLKELSHLPVLLNSVLEQSERIKTIAEKVKDSRSFLFLGRHLNYPIALEGALKLKEISYIHAEGYPAGEMKHGPIALIDENMPVVAIATESFVREKMMSNMEEVRARGGQVIALATEEDYDVAAKATHVLWVPKTSEALTPLLTIVPLQLLSYYVAVARGCDVDQPRNLAKSVTVE
jgi:glucosamine--fructose-6-phosphate aminotransferase (isomerizing)